MSSAAKLKLDHLSQEAATLLGCLWARAEESKHPQPILDDRKAREIVQSLDFDFNRIAKADYRAAEICIRATLTDGLVREFIERHPDGTVVELGVGLDSRFDRLDNGQVRWLEIDLPSVIELRRSFFDETPRRTFVPMSVLEDGWIDLAAERFKTGPVVFVSEGVLYWLGEENVRGLFCRLAERFPGSAIIFDSQSPMFVRYTHWRVRGFQQAKIRWAISNVNKIESWSPRLQVDKNIRFGDSPYYDSVIKRLPLHVQIAPRVFPPVRRFFQVSRVRFTSN